MATFSDYTAKTQEEIFSKFNTSLSQGLSDEQARGLLSRWGNNQIKSKDTSIRELLVRQLASPFIYLLFFSAVLAFILGEQIDAVLIVLFITINTVLGFYQEYHSAKSLALLKKYIVRSARVLRNGKEAVINSIELVPGDILILETGDIVPADVRIINEKGLSIDESILTGESVPVQKTREVLPEATKEIYKASNIVFSGTTVVSGKGTGVVIFTGAQTTLGDISHLATQTKHQSTFDKNINKLSKFILNLVAVTLIFVFLANLFIKGNSVQFTELLIFSIALAVSVIPEALPVVMTFSLARGAVSLAKNKVVVKRLSAIEDLGSIEILCTDKTGTITQNKLEVSDVKAVGEQNVLHYASLAAPFLDESKGLPNNAFDLSIHNAINEQERSLLRRYERVDEVPFDPRRRRNLMLVKKDSRYLLIARGAAEDIIKISVNIGSEIESDLRKWTKEMGENGKRVIAVAYKDCGAEMPSDLIEAETNLNLIGLISFIDPIKPTTVEAIKKAKELGVQVKIITGDSPEVAGAVAFQVGLSSSHKDVLTGEEVDALSPSERLTKVSACSVFARVTPEQKYTIIQTLQSSFEVGFLGEGINDAPALKIANVGLVVESASDVARESADIVLLKQSLLVIVEGIKEGRAVFANTLKYVKATLASNFGNFYAVAVASLILDYLPMLPIQILLCNLLSDFPMISIATDTVDDEDVKRPKNYDVRDIALFATVLGITSTVFDFIVFALFRHNDPAVLQTNWFIASVLTELIFLFLVRTKLFFLKSKRPSFLVLMLTGLAAFVTVLVPFTTFGNVIFKFEPPSTDHLILIAIVLTSYVIVTESVKHFYYKYHHNK